MKREACRVERGLLPAYAYTFHHAWHDHVYLPMMAKLIADMHAKGSLPQETL